MLTVLRCDVVLLQAWAVCITYQKTTNKIVKEGHVSNMAQMVHWQRGQVAMYKMVNRHFFQDVKKYEDIFFLNDERKLRD